MAPKRKSTEKIVATRKIMKTVSLPAEISRVSSMQLTTISTQLVPSLKRCTQAFFNHPSIDLAKSLLGKIIVRHINDGNTQMTYRLCARIVETEAYPGGEDMASHSFNGRRTTRNEAMYMSPGTAYVYIIYGMHHCFNISSVEDGGAVLVRACEPIEGIEMMTRNRGATPLKPIKTHTLCSGPSKLCQALAITKQQFDKIDLCTSDSFEICDGNETVLSDMVTTCGRVGMTTKTGKWGSMPWRFYIDSSTAVSVKAKK